jgi:hypothetical protein
MTCGRNLIRNLSRNLRPYSMSQWSSSCTGTCHTMITSFCQLRAHRRARRNQQFGRRALVAHVQAVLLRNIQLEVRTSAQTLILWPHPQYVPAQAASAPLRSCMAKCLHVLDDALVTARSHTCVTGQY